MYKHITEKEVNKLLKTLVFVKDAPKAIDSVNDDGESHILLQSYSGRQSFGVTDYKDHRNDSLETLKEKVSERLRECRAQRGHFYNEDGTIVDTIVVKGYLGGYTGNFVYKNKTYFGR